MPRYVSTIRITIHDLFRGPRGHLLELSAAGLPSAGPHLYSVGDGSYAFVTPVYADATHPFASAIKFVVLANPTPDAVVFGQNTAGEYYCLVPVVGGGVRIYDLALYRTTVRMCGSAPLGFDGCTENLEVEEGGGVWEGARRYEEEEEEEGEGEEDEFEYLYIVWREDRV